MAPGGPHPGIKVLLTQVHNLTLRTAAGMEGTWAPSRHPSLQSWVQRATFLSSAGYHQGHQLVQAPGREVRQEGEGKEDRGLGKKGRVPTELESGT